MNIIKIFFTFTILVNGFATAQIGIGTTTPKSALDIA